MDAYLDRSPFFRLLVDCHSILASKQPSAAAFKKLSSNLTRINSFIAALGTEVAFLNSMLNEFLISSLQSLYCLLQAVVETNETLKVLEAANESFKKTRRRLPPQAEAELANWLRNNSTSPYMSDELVDAYCDRFHVEGDQIRVFLTNSRRKMNEGVRKRRKINQF